MLSKTIKTRTIKYEPKISQIMVAAKDDLHFCDISLNFVIRIMQWDDCLAFLDYHYGARALNRQYFNRGGTGI